MTKFLSSGLISTCLTVAVTYLAAGPAHAQQATPFAFDSNGKMVGAIISDGVVTLPLIPESPTLYRLEIHRDRIGGIGTEYFASNDCSGPIYLASSGNLVEHAFVDVRQPDTIIYPNPNGTPTGYNSYIDSRDPSKCQQFSGGSSHYPAASVSVNTLGFSPPFSVRLK